jgi:hypothetical protein
MRTTFTVVLFICALTGYSQDSTRVRKLSYFGSTPDVTINFSKYSSLGLGVAFNYFPNYEHPNFKNIKTSYQWGADIEWGMKDFNSYYGLTLTNNFQFYYPYQVGFSFSYYNNSFSEFENCNLVLYPFVGVSSLWGSANFGYGFTLLKEDLEQENQRYPSNFIFQLQFRLWPLFEFLYTYE